MNLLLKADNIKQLVKTSFSEVLAKESEFTFLKLSVQELLNELYTYIESAQIKTKAGNANVPSVMRTICAFANEPRLDGSYLLLGVSEQDKHFVVTGVDDVDHLLQELSNNCRT